MIDRSAIIFALYFDAASGRDAAFFPAIPKDRPEFPTQLETVWLYADNSMAAIQLGHSPPAWANSSGGAENHTSLFR